MKINLLLLIFIGTLFIQCKNDMKNKHKSTDAHTEHQTKVNQHDHHEHEQHNHENKHNHNLDTHQNGNEVNQHMHDTPVSELIKRFESPERDEYQQPAKVLDYIGDINGQTILDIGAGSGYFSFRMAERGAHVIAGDVNDEFLDYMEKRKKETPLTTGKLDIRKLPFDHPTIKDKEADKAIIVNTYHHIENRVEYFNHVYEGLKADGELIVIDFFKKELPIGPGVDHKFSEEEVIKELKSAGFTQFEVESKLLEMQYIIRAKK